MDKLTSKNSVKALTGILFAAVVIIACFSEDGQNSEGSSFESSSSVSSDVSEDVAGHEDSAIIFESDELVNQLLIDYNAIAEHKIDPENIRKGNIRTKAIISQDDLYIVLINSNNSNNGFISVEITDELPLEESLYPVFRDLCLSLSSDILSDDLETAWNDIQSAYYEIDYNNFGDKKTYEVGGIEMQYLKIDSNNRVTVNLLYRTTVK